MLDDHEVGELLSHLVVTKVTMGIRRLLINAISRDDSIPQSAHANYITFPVVVTEDISKEVAMEMSKSVEIKIAYDVKRILQRHINEGPKDVQYDYMMNYLPIDKSTRAVDTTSMRITREALEAKKPEVILEQEAVDYVKNKVYVNVDVNYISEAHSHILKERGANPTNIDVEIKYINSKNDIQSTEYNLAIRAMPRYVDSNTLRMKLSTYDTDRFYKKFVKLTNDEETFIKDFLLDIDLMKAQAEEAVKGNSVFRKIDRKNLIRDMGIKKYPFTVFMLSEKFVKKLKSSEKMDIYQESRKIMKKLLAMALIIYDQDTDIVKLQYDGDDKFTKYPFDEVAKDTSRYEKELKQLVRLNK